MNREIIANMRFRAAHCRRLAKSLLDPDAAKSLLAMADHIEADAARLEANIGG